MTITEAEIVAAAKMLLHEYWGGHYQWDNVGVATRWSYMWRAYAALRAAREARRGK